MSNIPCCLSTFVITDDSLRLDMLLATADRFLYAITLTTGEFRNRGQCRNLHVGAPGYRPPKVISTHFLSARNRFCNHFQGHQRGGFCIIPTNLDSFVASTRKCALRKSSCRIGYEPTKNELRSLSAVDIQGHQSGGFCIVPPNLDNNAQRTGDEYRPLPTNLNSDYQ